MLVFCVLNLPCISVLSVLSMYIRNMKDRYRLEMVYVVSINGIPHEATHTSLKGACKSCDVSYNSASRNSKEVMRFVVGDNFVSIRKAHIIRQKKGRDSFNKH